jgi:16S rRNA (cytosine967-C5)-methyltransferase
MPAWKDGWFEVQDAGSQFIVASTEIVPGETVVDYCAGNGGKTLAMLSHIAASCSSQDMDMDNTIRSQHPTTVLWAHDIVRQRLAQLEGSLARVGVHPSIDLRVTDQKDELEHGMADVVLVDAPCSSCGALRRRPSHRWTLQSDELAPVSGNTIVTLEVARLVSLRIFVWPRAPFTP